MTLTSLFKVLSLSREGDLVEALDHHSILPRLENVVHLFRLEVTTSAHFRTHHEIQLHIFQVTAEQDHILKNAFSLIDFDGDGKLGEDEFRTLLRYPMLRLAECDVGNGFARGSDDRLSFKQ